MTLLDLRDLLLSTGIKVYHFDAADQVEKYIVWGESGENLEYADDAPEYEVVTGFISYITPVEYDSTVDVIRNTLTGAEVSLRLMSIAYNREMKLIKYTWRFEITPDGDDMYGDVSY